MSNIQHVVVVSRVYADNRTNKVGQIKCKSIKEATQLVSSLCVGPFVGEHCVRIMFYRGRILLPYVDLEYIAKDITEAMSFKHTAVECREDDTPDAYAAE